MVLLMEWEIKGDGSSKYLIVKLSNGEKVTLEPGSFLMGRGEYSIETKSGGVIKGLSRTIFGGESFFLNTFISHDFTELYVAPSLPGDIKYIPLSGSGGIILKDSTFLAAHGDITLTVAWKGITGAIAGSGLIWLKSEGKGGVWVSSFGAIEEIDVSSKGKVLIDNDHIVAFDNGLKWAVRKFGGLKSFIFGGEGFLIEFQGSGRLLIQSRNIRSLANALLPFIPKRG
jgi:uncharacterized protein (TIGR00266 family)